MLVHLSVRNYAIVEHLDLDLERGMTVITGETGAGKSIMLDALGLTLGDRADSDAVRPGADKADVLASFDTADIPEARQWLAERDLEQDGPCLLRRIITREGRSRGYINGSPCPLTDLKTLGGLLIDIHNQHEHQSLLGLETHRRLLDEYAGAGELVRQVQLAAQRWRQVRQNLERLTRNGDEQRARHQLLSYQLEELDNLALAEGELQALEQEQSDLASAEHILLACRQAMDLCTENEQGNALSAVNASMARLTAFDRPPAQIQEASNLLASAQIQIEEAMNELNRFVDHFEADPERQQAVQERLDSVYSLARKHRVQPEALLELHEQLRNELQSLDADDVALERLQEELAAFERHYQEKAGELSRLREQRAPELAAAVETEMQRLGMPGGRFSITLTPGSTGEPQPLGNEGVEFRVSANPGQPLRPLAKVASGGELSRISLAIQVITAQTSRTPTLVFDEVDVGIGGPTAEVVGQLLRQLGERGQVLTVTHLPQVAAQGHQHLFVHKERGTDETRTAVAKLDRARRVEEVARMLGGVDLTRESLAHARKLVVSR